MIFKTETAIPTAQCLESALGRFLTYEVPRRSRLWDYYEGTQGVNKGRVAAGRPNNTLVANWAKYITDVHTGYFMGLPPTFTFTGKRVQERMVAALAEASMDAVLYAVARDMSVCGQGYALAYLTDCGVRLARLDPRETFTLTLGIEAQVTAAVRVSPGKNGSARGELYTAGAVTDFTYDGRSVKLGTPRPLAFSGMPVSHFSNNLSGLGDFEPVTPLMDAHNLLLSGAMDDMQSVANAFLALYGMQGTTQEDIDRANLSRVLSLPEKGRAEFVVKNLSPQAITLLRDTLVSDMLMITMTPNLHDAAFGTGVSGVALEYKLWGAEQARAAKEQGLKGGMYHLIGLFFQGLSALGTPINAPCSARFYKNLPQDLGRLCQNLTALGDTVSRRTKLELLPFVNDPEGELGRIEHEKGAQA